MQNVVLTVHLILAALLIGVVLLQRSEGGGLGIGGGGGVMTGRQAANALSKATWILATGFLLTSMALFIIAGRQAGGGSVLDRIGGGAASAPAEPAGNLPTLPAYVPPPGVGQPVVPPAPAAPAEAGATAQTPAVPSPPVQTSPATAPAAPQASAITVPAARDTVAVPLGDPATAPASTEGARVITVPLQTPAAD